MKWYRCEPDGEISTLENKNKPFWLSQGVWSESIEEAKAEARRTLIAEEDRLLDLYNKAVEAREKLERAIGVKVDSVLSVEDTRDSMSVIYVSEAVNADSGVLAYTIRQFLEEYEVKMKDALNRKAAIQDHWYINVPVWLAPHISAFQAAIEELNKQ